MLGYVTARVVECVFIAVGILSVLAILTLRQEPAGADDDSLVAIGQSLVVRPTPRHTKGPRTRAFLRTG